MTVLTATEARSNLYRLIEDTNVSHKPTFIRGKKNSAVLIGADDWSSIQETLYLLSIPGMGETIIKGMQTPLKDCELYEV
jgi:prevent-host-death family protein